ncbi:MAG: hypothetical protein CVT89_04995 [Candidatus Altiarchaeales archaeon HGW-Altiarchaeales-2]|nr:MAG: hypothetical protein CVT89_04995 [Candidatus Altiarchaeales archaeon HGW-Altiarchaeales-2]
MVLLLQSHIKNLTDSLKISDNYNIKAIFIGALVGTFSHIIFDVCAHSNILAFWPISSQPFAIPLSLPINLFAILLTFVAVFWFASRFVFHQK